MKVKYTLPRNEGLVESSSLSDITHRYEKLDTNIYDSENQAVGYIADMITAMIRNHEESSGANAIFEDSEPFTLGLTTGKTPLGLYRELVDRYRAGKVSFRNVVVFTLDEFYPIEPDQQQSRSYRIHEDFLNHIDIEPENIHIIDGRVDEQNVSSYCAAYDKAARHIDLMIIGMGEQGQIGFNEAGTYAKSRTRLVQLSHNSRTVQSPLFFGIENTPKLAVTMGIGTIMRAKKIVLMAWGEEKAEAVRQVVEGEVNDDIPASHLQDHTNIEVIIDSDAADLLTIRRTPWLVGSCNWTPKFIRKAVVWLCRRVGKPILKLTYQDYINNSLGGLLESTGLTYDRINIDAFNDLQHTITGWPGGKPNADDTTRPVRALPFPKRVLIFAPHPDDDVISMGGTFHRLVGQGHEVHVAYQTSGSLGVSDEVLLQCAGLASDFGLEGCFAGAAEKIASKRKGEPETRELSAMKAALRRSEAKAAVRLFGLDNKYSHFLNMPFYNTGGIKKGELTDADVEKVVALLREIKPHQIYAAGDMSDPHGTHRICLEALMISLDIIKEEPWAAECNVWLYRGISQEWELGMVDMAVPLSPEEAACKHRAISCYLSLRDHVDPSTGEKKEYWLCAQNKNQANAVLFNELGMAEYQAMELFVKFK